MRSHGPFETREYAVEQSKEMEGRVCLLVEMPEGGEVKVVGVNEIALSVVGHATALGGDEA